MNDQLDHALDLMRRLPPQQIEKNLGDLINLVPNLGEDLLSSVDQPLKIARDKSTGKDYLLCDYNRDGHSYRSPWSNAYDPEIEDGTVPSEELRQVEIEANTAFAQYREMYYEGGVSSVYLWPINEQKVSESFAGALLIKHQVDGSTKIKGCWDSIHLFEVEKPNEEKFHYKLTSSFILWLRTARKVSGTIRIGASITRQSTKDLSFDEHGSHVGNLGSMVEEMENRIWNSFTSVYMGKTSYVVNSIRLAKPQEQRKPDVLTSDLVSSLNKEKSHDEKPKPEPKPKPRPKVAPIPAVRSSKAPIEPKKDSLLHLEERKRSLEQEIHRLNDELKECLDIHSQNNAQLSSLNEAIMKIMEQQGKIFDDNGINDVERNERIDSLKKLETIKHEKDLFHQKCKQEKKRMEREIKQYTRLSEEPEDLEDLDELEKELEIETNKLKEIKLELAAKNREVATFQRTLDDIPSRAELNQYQKRLVELYNQVASKHFETKKFYILYNQLEDTRIHLEKELSLLDSILNNFNHAMASPQTKDQFMSQFEQIVENIRQAQVKVDRIKQNEKFRKDQLSENYKDLIEKQRSYYKAVRELKEEMRKNELLTAK